MEPWRKYGINADGQFDRTHINAIIDRRAQNMDFDLNNDGKKDIDDALAPFLKLAVMDRSCNGVLDDRQSSSSEESFHTGPVGYPIPDPTVTNSTEAIMNYLKVMGITLPAEAEAAGKEQVPKIEPDLLVKFGDVKTWFGGEGSKIIDNSEGPTVNREEFSSCWQATRKKRNPCRIIRKTSVYPPEEPSGDKRQHSERQQTSGIIGHPHRPARDDQTPAPEHAVKHIYCGSLCLNHI